MASQLMGVGVEMEEGQQLPPRGLGRRPVLVGSVGA